MNLRQMRNRKRRQQRDNSFIFWAALAAVVIAPAIKGQQEPTDEELIDQLLDETMYSEHKTQNPIEDVECIVIESKLNKRK